MTDLHKNFAASLVATAPSPAASGTSLVVTAAEGALFPTVPFNATIKPAGEDPTAANAEIVRVTGVSTDTLTIVRAQENTSARTVVVGDQIAATITVKTLTDAEGLIFDSTVTGADAATIDTGASVIPDGYKVLEIWLYARTDEVTIPSAVAITLNNDTSSIYDNQRISGLDTSLSGAGGVAAAGWINNVAGASAAASVFGLMKISVPNYDGTAGYKIGDMYGGFADTTAANSTLSVRVLSYRSTSAITRVTATPVTALKKFKIGSRLTIFGR